MRLIGFKKKKNKWKSKIDVVNGVLKIEYSYEPVAFNVPIIEAKLHYEGIIHYNSGFRAKYTIHSEETMIDALKGNKPSLVHMNHNDSVAMIKHLINRDDNSFEYYDNGYFFGNFTFIKTGGNVFITPFTGNLLDEKMIEDVAS